jgi:hypothetical protein
MLSHRVFGIHPLYVVTVLKCCRHQHHVPKGGAGWGGSNITGVIITGQCGAPNSLPCLKDVSVVHCLIVFAYLTRFCSYSRRAMKSIQQCALQNPTSVGIKSRVFRRDSPPTRSRRSTGSGGESPSMLTIVEGNSVQAFSGFYN